MPPEPAAPKFILMIEDNCDHAEPVIRLLELNGFMAECASSGEDGLNRIEEVSPDLILLDFTLPDMSGAGRQGPPEWEPHGGRPDRHGKRNA